jgi:hypothetical protein
MVASLTLLAYLFPPPTFFALALLGFTSGRTTTLNTRPSRISVRWLTVFD